MTKNEVLEKIADIYDKVSQLEIEARNMTNDLKDIREILESIPEDPGEIVEGKKNG